MATSSQIRDTLKSRLISKAGISEQEPVNTGLADFLDEALAEHAPSNAPDGQPDFTLIPRREHELVILLAWIRVCEYRASNAAPQPSLRGSGNSGFGADRDTPFSKNMKMAEYLRKKYDELVSALDQANQGRGSGDITVGEFFRRDEVLDAAVPLMAAPGLSAPALSLGNIVGVAAGGANLGSVILTWEATLSPYFAELYLIRAPSAFIRQMWNTDGVDGIPFIDPSATKVYSTTDNIAKGTKEQNLAAGTYYYLLAMRDTSEQWSFSNEISVTVPA